MFVEFTQGDGTPISVDLDSIRMYTPARVVSGDILVPGSLVVVQGVGRYYVLEPYDLIKSLMIYEKVKTVMGKGKTVKKTGAGSLKVLKMKPKGDKP